MISLFFIPLATSVAHGTIKCHRKAFTIVEGFKFRAGEEISKDLNCVDVAKFDC